MLLEWLRGLDEATRAMIVGVVAQYIVQVLKWAGEKLEWNVAEAKLTKLVTAGVMAAAATVLLTGFTPAFWKEWLFAFASAVMLHEVGNKANRKVKKAVKKVQDQIAFDGLSLMLLAVVLLSALILTAPAGADGWQGKLRPTPAVIGSLNGGPAIGAAASWDLVEVWGLGLEADLFVKRENNGTDWGGGISTEALPLLEKFPVVRVLVPILDRVFPEETLVGWGYLMDAGKDWWYLKAPITSF